MTDGYNRNDNQAPDDKIDGIKPSSGIYAQDASGGSGIKDDIKALMDLLYIKTVPSFGNNFFFTIGVYLLEIFVILAVTGMIMVVFGPYWWSTTAAGEFLRSIHLWAAEAFVTLLFVHFFVNLSTSAYKHKKLVWIIGSFMLMLALLEYAFGIGMSGDFIAQWNAIAGADLWNGLGLGFWVNPLNEGAVYGWHIAIVPILLISLVAVHYMTVKRHGINTPYRKDIHYSMVSTDHKKMYRRMAYILVLILVFATLLRAPYTPPLTVQSIAKNQPRVFAITLLNEFNFSSPTATYLDTIDPYTYNMRLVYVTEPYEAYAAVQQVNNSAIAFIYDNASVQDQYIAGAFSYFENNGSIVNATASTNPLVAVIGGLVIMADSGLYQQALQEEGGNSLNQMYALRLMYDSGVMSQQATQYGLRVEQWGMLKIAPNGWQLSYFLAPYNLLEILTNGIPWWNDIENGVIAGFIFIIILLLPYIPYLRDVPDKLGLYKIFWNRFTVPEIKRDKRELLEHTKKGVD